MRHAAAAAAQHCRNTCIVRALFQHSSHSSMQLFCDGQCTCWLSCMLPKPTSSCSRLMNASCHCTVHGVKICDPADLHTSRLALSCIFGCSVIVEVYSNCHSATTSWCILSHTRAFARTVRCERPQKKRSRCTCVPRQAAACTSGCAMHYIACHVSAGACPSSALLLPSWPMIGWLSQNGWHRKTACQPDTMSTGH